MNIYTKSPAKKFESLGAAITTSYRALTPFRNINRRLVEAYAGPGYGGRKGREKLLNKMNQAVDAYMTVLAANRPQVQIETKYAQLKPFAVHFQVAINNFLKEIGIEHTIRRWVMDAFFCVGVVKVHLADSGLVQLEDDLWMDPGIPFASNVSVDDLVYDMSAKKITTMKFCGDIYRIPYDDIIDGIGDGVYTEEARKLTPTSKYSSGDDGRLEEISRGDLTDKDEFEPMIDLMDVWLPRDGMIYTFPVQRGGESITIHGEPIAELPWEDDKGPYHFLSFNDVPENIMPVSPASHLDGLDRLINNMMRKVKAQAERHKQNPVYSPAGVEDAKRLREYGDGEWVLSSNPGETRVVEQGGVNPNTMAFINNAISLFDTQAGNLVAMLGLGAQSQTVGQEQLIHSAGNKKIGQMQARVVEASTGLITSLGLLLWMDEFTTVSGAREIPGTDIQIEKHWKPGERAGKFLNYNFKIIANSMSFQTPSQKANAFISLMNQFYIPMQPMIMQQGGVMNLQKINKFFADSLEIPQIEELIQFPNDGLDELSPQAEVRGTKPPSTTRNYVRSGRPQQTSEADKMASFWASSGSSSGNGSANGTAPQT